MDMHDVLTGYFSQLVCQLQGCTCTAHGCPQPVSLFVLLPTPVLVLRATVPVNGWLSGAYSQWWSIFPPTYHVHCLCVEPQGGAIYATGGAAVVLGTSDTVSTATFTGHRVSVSVAVRWEVGEHMGQEGSHIRRGGGRR